MAAHTGFNILADLNSAKHSYEEYMESARLGRPDIEALKDFRKRLIKERCVPVIERWTDDLQTAPEYTSKGIYQMVERDRVTGGDYLRIMLHCSLALGDEELLENYIDIISKTEVVYDDAYRIIKITDPLEEFLKYTSIINPPKNIVEDAENKLNEIHEKLANTRIDRGEEYSYLIANITNKPQAGFRHLIRVMSYYLIKHFDKHNSQVYNDHIHTMKNILLKRESRREMHNEFFLAYDMAHFNNIREVLPEVDFPLEGYSDLSRGFYCFSPSLAMMFDLLCDHANLGNQDSHDLAKSIHSTYKASMSSSNPYDMQSPNFLFAPVKIRGINNFPLTMFAYRTLKEQFFDNSEKESIFWELLKRIDTGKEHIEGIVPCSKLRAKDPDGYAPTSDLYALLAINEYIQYKDT